MNSSNSSPPNDLPEPLRSLIEDIRISPVPEDLIPRSQPVAVFQPVSVTSKRSVVAVVATGIVLGFCVWTFTDLRSPSERSQPNSEKPPSLITDHKETIPPPSLWAYREVADSGEDLEKLLTQHASALLPSSSDEVHRPFFRNR